MSVSYRIPVPAVDFRPPVYVCRYNEKPFVLDGNLDPFINAYLKFMATAQ